MHPNQLKWLCRRGMKELDALMQRYLAEHYPTVSDDEKRAFEALLQLPDPVLIGYLLKGEPAPDELTRSIVRRLLG